MSSYHRKLLFGFIRTIIFILAVSMCGYPLNAPVHNGGMVLINAKNQSFLMGQAGIADTVHQVTFTYDFWLDTTEVTQADFSACMGYNPSYYKGDNDAPVERVSWCDAALYCNTRSKNENLDTFYVYASSTASFGGVTGVAELNGLSYNVNANGYRLPTEAEWEFAARAGTTTIFYWGDTLDDTYCWNLDNSDLTTHKVATRKPNKFGLYDMIGNVLEWTMSVTASNKYPDSSVTDPPPVLSSQHSARGGKFSSDISQLSIAFRYPSPIFYQSTGTYGFRAVKKAGLASVLKERSFRNEASVAINISVFINTNQKSICSLKNAKVYDIHGRRVTGDWPMGVRIFDRNHH